MKRLFLITCVKHSTKRIIPLKHVCGQVYLTYFHTIGFLGPINGSLAAEIKFLCYLEAEILTKTVLQPFCKTQGGGHIHIKANGNTKTIHF